MLSNDNQIERINKDIKDCEAIQHLDTSYNNTSLKTLKKLKTALRFAEYGGVGIEVFRDSVVIDDKYVATLYSKSWKALNKNKWYRYGDPVDLLHKLRGSADA